MDVTSIELLALGTSSQVPTRQRNHNGYLLRFGDEDILFDPGEGTQRQLARARVGVERVRRIFITHFHGDHCLGVPRGPGAALRPRLGAEVLRARRRGVDL
jgi:ribonuclease BN (tRNA processing enzyme)